MVETKRKKATGISYCTMEMMVNGKRVRPLRLILLAGFIFVLVYLSRNVSVGDNFAAEPVDPIYEFVDQNSHGDHKIAPKHKNPQFEITGEFLDFMDSKTSKCLDYVEYSKTRHAPFSSGKHAYPYMRPAPKCRTFVSKLVDLLIDDLKSKIADPDLARLVENCLPNTLDTTVLWHKPSGQNKNIQPQTFIVTGDIHAEWLRDSARQLSVYQPLIKHDPALKEMIKGAINTQAKYVLNSPYCNAFHPPPGSGVRKGNTAKDLVYPMPDWEQVFECKYEIDSLASFLTLSNDYFENSGGDSSFLTKTWWAAYEKLLVVFRRESQPSFDEETGYQMPYYYTFQRHTTSGSETLPLGGVGNPVNYGTGLVRSAFRPSDDSCILQFFIPGNIHALTELRRTKKNLLTAENIEMNDNQIVLDVTEKFIQDITRGIEEHGIVNHPRHGKVYAYEVDGYGGSTFMDDANIPSLLSIPDLGFTSVNDEVYQNTRKMILEKSANPYYLKGRSFEGIGGPHVGLSFAWPMSLLIRIRTTDDDNEITKYLSLVMDNTAGLGLMHEGINVHSQGGMDYTRPWFAWCNSEFGKTILHLAKHKPHLIFKEEYATIPYDIDTVFNSLLS
jgi:meiotically up-regulated gene 157 (Mug157) protein